MSVFLVARVARCRHDGPGGQKRVEGVRRVMMRERQHSLEG